MGAPREPRQKRQKANTAPKHNPMAERWKNPALRPKAVGAGRPAGVADGYSKKQIEALRAQAEADAERIMENMEDEDLLLDALKASGDAEKIVDDEKASARVALKAALTMVLMPGNAKDKMAAIRTVLEWTKAKPASTVNNNVNAAEDFLRALATKDEKKPD